MSCHQLIPNGIAGVHKLNRFFSIICAITLTAILIRPLSSRAQNPDDQPFLVVLGISQDAGFPQAGCARDCCKAAWQDPSK